MLYPLGLNELHYSCLKSGGRSVPSNYRPISLTYVVSEVLERIIRKHVSSFIDKKGFLNSTQHGFRSRRSWLSALLNVFDDIMHMLDGGGSVDMVYLDFSKAFDKGDHGILLHKLKALGITGNLGMWFYNFLTNRSHFVRLPGGISADSPVLSSVPQGTVLGPYCFWLWLLILTKMYLNLTLSVLLMIHGFILKCMMYLIVTYCNMILIIYMTGHPLITCF